MEKGTLVRLDPMTAAEFADYLQTAITDYAGEYLKAGVTSFEKALEMARDSYQKLLPAGLDTPDQYLFTIRDTASGQKHGLLWFAVEDHPSGKRAYIYDLAVSEGQRRQGYGTGALQALEDKVRELGLNKIMLHVFGHNHAARALYQKLGFEPVHLILSKHI